MAYETLIAETRGNVGLITFNRPKALNALSSQLMTELTAALDAFEADENVRAMVITGSERAFAAGLDITEVKDLDYMDAYQRNLITAGWERLASCRKPVIAAVAGYALGGGCEVAMMCDMIFAADNAVFGQPEIKLGVIPGAGGTQRLTRAVGKAKAMDMVLTGRNMKAEEAERSGLVARVVPVDALLDVALEAAATIASYSAPITMMAKDCVNASHEMGLSEGVRLERRVFHACFATEDQSEGMDAFVSKRPAEFKHR
ncbi:MAG: enoyl-CoA hydratase [Pseudomonadota bacterium]